MQTTDQLPIIQQALGHKKRCAIIDDQGEYSYRQLLVTASQIAGFLLAVKPARQQIRVTFLFPPGFLYVAAQWGIWLAGDVAVPHCVSHPAPELEYVIADSQAELCFAAPQYAGILRPLAKKHNAQFVEISAAIEQSINSNLPAIALERPAMILYTSGTTSKPKGVVLSHHNITAQITSLIQAWGWTRDDHILNVLPLHHTHGIVNILSCALWAGACCEFLPKFDAAKIWHSFIHRPLTLFMAVPTIYNRLIAEWENAHRQQQKQMSQACRKMRLMVSGSAALPVSVLEKWQEISGHTLLERYGMTEIGMALSNPLVGERQPGFVGQPLPGVSVRVVDDDGVKITKDGFQGELQVKGDKVFTEYWQRPQATHDAFVEGWFKTGDIVIKTKESFKIIGRNSVDIIKTGGYKVSALEIEEVLRKHPNILECAVVGVEDSEWGEVVCAALTLRPNVELSTETIRSWAKAKLAPYKVPGKVKIVETLPRNVMGKVTKPEVKNLFAG